MKSRAGSRIYKGALVPINSKIFMDNKGREFRVHSINETINFIYLDNNQIVKRDIEQKILDYIN
jgi:hypothetical protein